MISDMKKLNKFNKSVHYFKRNYLYGRFSSYLPSEGMILKKIISEKEMRIFVGTWNMNGQKPVVNLSQFLFPDGIENAADLIVIGTQESFTCDINKWEFIVQNSLGPSYISTVKKQLGKLHIILFLRRELSNFSSVDETKTILLNKYTPFKTKGAIFLTIAIFGIRFLFITAHLTPHLENLKLRTEEIKKIIHFKSLQKQKYSNHNYKENYDYVFLFGDLNFRINLSREEVYNWINNTYFCNKFPIVLHDDQLKNLIDEKIILKNFNEAQITFPPTYKYEYKSQILDSSTKLRTPSYTDRILYNSKITSLKMAKSNEKIYIKAREIRCLKYDSVRNISSSDHKPVYAIFAVNMHKYIDKEI